MKLLNKGPTPKQPHSTLNEISDSLNFDLNCLLKPMNGQNGQSSDIEKNLPTQDTSDDFLVDISDEKMLDVAKTPEIEKPKISQQRTDIKLNDIFVKLENIKPSSHPSIIVLEEKNGVNITLHLAKDKPKAGVNVYVITTVSKNVVPLSNYLFQAVAPKVS